METAKEILISASVIKSGSTNETFEFIINNELEVIDSIKIESIPDRKVYPVKEPGTALEGILFELNHVRVNPKINNEQIIQSLVLELTKIGIAVKNQPDKNSMSICFKPLGEIESTVRFTVNHKNKLILMSPSKPKLVCYR